MCVFVYTLIQIRYTVSVSTQVSVQPCGLLPLSQEALNVSVTARSLLPQL